MSVTQYAYILREIRTQTSGNGVAIGSEGVFYSYEEAVRLMDDLAEDVPDCGPQDTQFRIIRLPIGSPEPWEDEKTWYFDANAKLLHTSSSDTQDAVEFGVAGYSEELVNRFARGDIVFVRAYPWNQASTLSLDTYGVIDWNPFSDGALRDPDSAPLLDRLLVIMIIERNGLLDHAHVPVNCLELYTGNLPPDQQFLRLLSEHYKGIRRIPDALLDDVYDRKLIVSSLPVFPFHEFKCLGAGK